jgi:hypothetical protein
MAQGRPVKVKMALQLRAQTVMTMEWIANRLQMGTRTHLNHLLYWHRRGKGLPLLVQEAPLITVTALVCRPVLAIRCVSFHEPPDPTTQVSRAAIAFRCF